MNDFFPYKVDLPFSDKTIYYRELNTQEQINIAKNNLIHSNTRDNHLDYFNTIFSILIHCVKNPLDLKDLNIVDYIFFVAKLRLVSISNIFELSINSESKEFKNIKINVDINFLVKNLYKITSELMKNNTLTYQDFEIELGWPLVSDVSVFSNLLSNDKYTDFDRINNAIPLFLKSIKIKNNVVCLANLDQKQRLAIYDQIPSTVTNEIQSRVIDIVSTLKETDIFGFPEYIFYKFDFFNLVFVDIIKLLFLFNLNIIYNEIYLLSKRNMNEEYILTLSPTERQIYLSYENNAEEKTNKQEDSELTDIEKLQMEFPE